MPETQTYHPSVLEDLLLEWMKTEIYHPKKTTDDRQTKTGDAKLDGFSSLTNETPCPLK